LRQLHHSNSKWDGQSFGGYLGQFLDGCILSAGDMLELEAMEAALRLPHLARVRLHQWAELYSFRMAGRELRITPDGETRDPHPGGDPWAGQQGFTFGCAASASFSGEGKLDGVLAKLTCRGDQKHTRPHAFPGLSAVEVGNPVVGSFFLGL
jgi:hypothetical protein